MRKIIATVVVFLLAGACVVGAVALVQPDVLSVRPIAADSPCPVVGCASGECHGFDDVPEPDGVHEMMCPEAGCTSVECHGWDSLIGRYHQASDMSLNVWILMPVALVLGLWLLVRRMGRLGRVHDDSRADDGMAEASSPVAPSERHCAENLMTAGEEGACYEA